MPRREVEPFLINLPDKKVLKSYSNFNYKRNLNIPVLLLVTLLIITLGAYFLGFKTDNHPMKETDCNPREDVKLIFYSKRNPNVIEVLNVKNKKIIKRFSNFDSSLPTRYLIHGWNSDRNIKVNVEVREALYRLDNDLNIVVVEWKNCAGSRNYSLVRSRLKSVGNVLGEIIDFIEDTFPHHLSQAELIGHSFGAHIAGFAGKFLKSRNRILHAILGLDPAGPEFSIDDQNNRLDKFDADYVEAIHTSVYDIGFLEPLGHVDHYPNVHDEHQPGCHDLTCDHNSAIEYFVESIGQSDKFSPQQCFSFKQMIDDQCRPTGVVGKVGGEPLNTRNPPGVFYFETQEQ